MLENIALPAVSDNTEMLADVLRSLENLYQLLNAGLFENQLSMPVIVVATKGHRKDAHGWCTVEKAWRDGEANARYELNIGAEFLNRDLMEICETLLHEMVHLKNLESGIEDCSRNRTYHNERFKQVAEKHGLKAEKVGINGYANTILTNQAEQLIQTFEFEKFNIYRELHGGAKRKTKQSSIKYTCPLCETIIRATRKVNVRCGDCNCLFVSA